MISKVASLHPDLTFDWAVANKDAVNDKVDSSSRTRFIPGLGQASSNPATAEKIKASGRGQPGRGFAQGSRQGRRRGAEPRPDPSGPPAGDHRLGGQGGLTRNSPACSMAALRGARPFFLGCHTRFPLLRGVMALHPDGYPPYPASKRG
ncbi:hypothetical protein ACRAWD_17360 [Caulobacter segnis]